MFESVTAEQNIGVDSVLRIHTCFVVGNLSCAVIMCVMAALASMSAIDVDIIHIVGNDTLPPWPN